MGYIMNRTYNGKLDMNDNGEFIIHIETGTVNISKILDDIFTSQLRPLVYVKIYRNGKLIFEEDGGLFLNTDDQKVQSYFVCGNNLSKCLFYETDNFLEITINQRRKSGNGNGTK